MNNIYSLEYKHTVTHTMSQILDQHPHLFTSGFEYASTSKNKHDRIIDFCMCLDGLELALEFLSTHTPMPKAAAKRRVCSYSLKHTIENPSGNKFLGSVPNGVLILAALMLDFPVWIYPGRRNADIGINWRKTGGTIWKPRRIEYL